MYQARRSVKSSSSENEGEEIQTPTKKSVRVPLQEVLPQCSAQRDLINSISKRRSVAVPGTNLTPLIRRLHLQDDGLQVSSLVYEDLCQKIFVEEDCVNVPQARGLTPLVTHTAPKANALRGTRSLSAASGLHSTVPECLPTEGADSAPASVHWGALTYPALKGEPVAIEAKEDPKLLIGDTTITSGLVGHRSSTPVEMTAGQTLAGPVPKAGTGSHPPANLELAEWPDAFQSSYPRVMADTSCGIVPEMEVDEGLAEVSLKLLASVDGLSTLSGIEPMGASTGHLPRVEVEGGAEEVGQVEGGAEEVGQVEGGAEEVGQVEGGAEEVGQVEGGAEEVGQVEGGAEEVGQVEGGAEEVGQVEGGAEEVGQVEGGAEEVGQVEGGAEEVGQVEGGAEEVGQVEGGAEEVGQVEGGAEEVGQVEGGAEEVGQVEGGAEEVGQVDACQTETGVEIGEVEQLGAGQVQVEQVGAGQVQVGAGQVEVGQVGTGQVQVGAGQVEVGQVGAGQVEVGQVGAGQVEVEQVGTGQVEVEQVGTGQVEVEQVGTGQVQVEQVGTGQVQVEQVGTGQVQVGQVGTGQVQVGQVGAGQVQVGQVGAGQVDMGTSPMPALQPCALICLVHNGSLQTPTDSWRLLAGETGRSRVTCRDFGTAITPMGTRCASTCMTPVSLAEKDVNTSASEGIQIEVMDSAVLTDSLLWKFCREDLESIPREDLERRLETALLINEVLSSQLSDLSKSKGMGLRAGPADQRETFTQTDSSQAPEVEDHYHSLYLQHASTVRELELSLEQYQQLCSAICNSRKQQNVLVEEVGECLAGADGAYEEMKSERVRMHKQYQEMRKLLKSNMEMMNTMRERTQRAFQECAESRTLAETALREKEAVDQCCRDLSVSCADRVSQLELDLTTWQRMCGYLQDASVEQHALCGEFEMVAETAESTYHQMVENQQKLHLQLEVARDLSHQSTIQLQTMTQAMGSALEERAALRKLADEAEWKMANMQQELEQSAYGLRDALDKVKRLNCENLQLKSGLATLTDQVAEVEEERDKLMKDNSRYFVDLATTEASLKLSQAALAEKTEKLQTCKAQSKELVDALRENIKSLEEAVDKLKQEKEGMESSLVGSQAHVTHLTKAVKLKDEKLQELSDIQAQAALIADNSEFMEQELKVAREQLMETEGQLSEQVRLLHNRNLECEELRAQCDCFQRNLDTVKKDAREMLLEMGEQMNQAMVEVLALKGQIQDVTKSAETTMKNWQQNRPVTVTGTDQLPPASQTKEEVQETVQSSKECQEGAPCDIRSDHSAFVPIEPTISKPPDCDTGASLDIGSCRGAFTRVEPIIPKKTEVEDTLLLTVADLREALLKLLNIQSLTERAKQQQLQDLQQEISKVREQRKATYSKNWLELKSLQDKVGVLETENRRLNRDLQAQVKTNSELEKALSLQDETILEFNKQMETNFKEHTEFLAMQEEVTGLKRELQRTETEAHTYREELTKLQDSEGALDMNWLQEKVQLQHQVRKLREADLQKENDIQELKVKMNRHRAILEQNYHKAEAELAKLDDLIEHVRIVLLSVPDVVASSVELRSLLHYLGEDVGE